MYSLDNRATMHPEDETHVVRRASVAPSGKQGSGRSLYELNWQLIEFDHIMLICLCHL